MKCALELQMKATVRAEEIRKAKIEAERKEKIAIRANTLAECERIGLILESEADKGKQPFYHFHVSNWDNRVLKETREDYADRRVSYNSTTLKLDLDLMREWFAQYCFAVKLKEFYYYEYGCGCCSGWTVYIEPSAECLK